MNSSPDKPDLSRLRIPRESGAPAARASGRIFYLKLLISLVLAAVLVWIFLLRSKTVEEDAAVSQPVKQSPANNTAAAPAAALPRGLNATGYVVAQRRAAVSSKATGRLKDLRAKEGDKVTADEIIGVLENEDLLRIVEREKANLEVAKARVQVAEAELWAATADKNRTQRVTAEALSAASKEVAEARYRRALADVAATKAAESAAAAAVKEAEVNVEYTLIRAPFDGTVLTKNADIGEIVAPFGSSVDARAAVVTIADMSSLQVEADVSEANFAKVFVGQSCKVVLDSFPEKTYRGVVDSIVPTVDRAKATVLVKIRFLDKDERVIPEMSAKVEFLLDVENK